MKTLKPYTAAEESIIKEAIERAKNSGFGKFWKNFYEDPAIVALNRPQQGLAQKVYGLQGRLGKRKKKKARIIRAKSLNRLFNKIDKAGLYDKTLPKTENVERKTEIVNTSFKASPIKHCPRCGLDFAAWIKWLNNGE